MLNPYFGLGICCLIGTVSSSAILFRLGLLTTDPLLVGSKNAGFSNTKRISAKYSYIVAVLDISKGILAYVLMQWLGVACLIAASTTIGRGKGIANLIGGLIAHNPFNALIVPIWLMLAKILYPAVASMMIACFALLYLPVKFYWLVAWIIYRHRDNLLRLLAGSENKL